MTGQDYAEDLRRWELSRPSPETLVTYSGVAGIRVVHALQGGGDASVRAGTTRRWFPESWCGVEKRAKPGLLVPTRMPPSCRGCLVRYGREFDGADWGLGSWAGTVPDLAPPSANVFQRLHWAERERLIRDWYTLVLAAFGRHRRMPNRARAKRRVRIVVTSRQMRDAANLVLAADKLILDNLVRLGWLADDSPDWLDLKVDGATGAPRTEILIEDLLETLPGRGRRKAARPRKGGR